MFKVLTFWFSLFGLFLVGVPKGEPFLDGSFGLRESREAARHAAPPGSAGEVRLRAQLL